MSVLHLCCSNQESSFKTSNDQPPLDYYSAFRCNCAPLRPLDARCLNRSFSPGNSSPLYHVSMTATKLNLQPKGDCPLRTSSSCDDWSTFGRLVDASTTSSSDYHHLCDRLLQLPRSTPYSSAQYNSMASGSSSSSLPAGPAPSVSYHCACQFTDPVLPIPDRPSASSSYHDLHSLYFCEECDAIKCERCVSTEISCYFCPHCLFEVPNASVRAELNRCVQTASLSSLSTVSRLTLLDGLAVGVLETASTVRYVPTRSRSKHWTTSTRRGRADRQTSPRTSWPATSATGAPSSRV